MLQLQTLSKSIFLFFLFHQLKEASFFFFISLYFSQHCSTVQNVCDRESINHSTVSSEIYSMPNCYIRLDYLQVNLFLNKQQVGRPLYKLNTFHYLFSLKLEKWNNAKLFQFLNLKLPPFYWFHILFMVRSLQKFTHGKFTTSKLWMMT